jgi:biotin carboxyl carrier protein
VDYDVDGSVIKVGYRFVARGGVTIAIDGEPLADVDVIGMSGERVGLQVGPELRWFDVARNGWVHHVDGPGGYVRLVEQPRFPVTAPEDDPGSLHAPMPGRIVKVLVGEGEEVTDGQVVIVLEAMKMEHSLRAPYDGVVRSIASAPGDQVEAGHVLVVVEPRT